MTMSPTVLLALLPITVETYNGTIMERDEGVVSVEFPNLCDAARYINAYLLHDRARIQSDGNGVSEVTFWKSVIIEFNTAEEMD